MNKKIFFAYNLLSLTLNLCSMDIPDEEAVQQSEDDFACHFDTMPDELALHIFGYTANQETVKERFQQVGQLSLVDKKWAGLATDESFLRSIVPKYADKEFIALGEKLATYVSQGKEIAWSCPNYLPHQAKEAIKKGLLKSPVVWNFFKRTREGLKASITSVAISSDNRFIATGSSDGTAKIWDVTSGRCIKTLQCHIDDINSIAISKDNSFVVTGSWDGTAKICGVKFGNCITSLEGNTDVMTSVTISSDNSFIVTGSSDGTAKIWEVSSGKCITTLEGHTEWITSVAISRDNNLIVTGSYDKTAKIWDAISGNCITTLEGHTDNIKSVAISSNNSFVVTGSRDGTARIWDVVSGNCIITLEGHTLPISSVPKPRKRPSRIAFRDLPLSRSGRILGTSGRLSESLSADPEAATMAPGKLTAAGSSGVSVVAQGGSTPRQSANCWRWQNTTTWGARSRPAVRG